MPGHFSIEICNTYADTSNLIEYKLNIIDKKSVRFEPGTSIITPPRIIAPAKPVKNAVKTDLLSWAFNVGVLKHERVFTENISAHLGFHYSWDFISFDNSFGGGGNCTRSVARS